MPGWYSETLLAQTKAFRKAKWASLSAVCSISGRDGALMGSGAAALLDQRALATQARGIVHSPGRWVHGACVL